jgi:hypothetical protein
MPALEWPSHGEPASERLLTIPSHKPLPSDHQRQPTLLPVHRRAPPAPAYCLPLGEPYRATINGSRAGKALVRAFATSLRPAPKPAQTASSSAPKEAQPITFATGDWLINLGASWERPHSAAFPDHLTKSDAHFSLFAHDIIPDIPPEWFRMFLVAGQSLPPLRPCVRHLQPHAQRLRRLPGAPQPSCPPRTLVPPGSNSATAITPLSTLLTEPYVLMVGSIEVRKNHGGVVHIWRHMLNNPPTYGVPTLVFAGRTGWLTTDLMKPLDNADYLGSKIKFFVQPRNPSSSRFTTTASSPSTRLFMRGGGLGHGIALLRLTRHRLQQLRHSRSRRAVLLLFRS